MDWTLAIDRNREALLRIAAMLFAAAGLASGGSVAVLPRAVRSTVLRALRPAESALRRLIQVVKLVNDMSGGAAPKVTPRLAPAARPSRGAGDRIPAFPLFDPRKRIGMQAATRFAAVDPRIRFFDDPDPVFEPQPPEPSPDDLLSAHRLCLRLQSLQRALNSLPQQARRLARVQARRAQQPSPRQRRAPMRPGRPPGHKARQTHPVDEILSDCHALALYALTAPDTS